MLHDEFDGRYDFKFDANLKSALSASPLHFAVIFRELKNVEILIKYKADVNITDKEGRTPLHIAVIRLCTHFAGRDDQESSMQNAVYDEIYLEYKIIIKELLFNGASREAKS